MVFFRTLNGNTITLDLDPSTTTLHSLKLTIQTRYGMPIHFQRLFHASAPLPENDEMAILADQAITPNSTVRISVPLLTHHLGRTQDYLVTPTKSRRCVLRYPEIRRDLASYLYEADDEAESEDSGVSSFSSDDEEESEGSEESFTTTTTTSEADDEEESEYSGVFSFSSDDDEGSEASFTSDEDEDDDDEGVEESPWARAVKPNCWRRKVIKLLFCRRCQGQATSV